MGMEGSKDFQEGSGLHLTVDDLPNELLLRVIENIDPKDYGNAVLVSKRWYAIINEMVGRKLFVGRQCQLVPQDEDRYVHTYVDISEIAKIGIHECYVGEVVEPTGSMTLWTRLFTKLKKTLFSEDKDPEFKYPYLVKTLHFDGPIPAKCFESMVKNVVNLKRVELHMTAFCNLDESSVLDLGQKWKNLEDLSIWGHKLTDGLFTHFYDYKNIVPNLVTFLNSSFHALTYLALEYPFDLRDDRNLTREILSFLRRHRKLTVLRICINIPISEEGSDFDTFEDREWTREARMASRQLRLSNLELIVSSMRKVRLTKVWMAFVEHQRNLQIATVLSFRIPATLLSSICENNKEYLKKLFISRILMTAVGRPVQVDASIIAPCTQLISLTMEGMLHSTTIPGLTSSRLLPKTLVNLEIGGMLMIHSDAHDLFFELPNLNSICLTDIGNQGRFGVTIETLQLVILDRRINAVTIYRSFNGQYPAVGILNGDRSTNAVIRQRPYEILEMKLNAGGYYENMYRTVLIEDFEDE